MHEITIHNWEGNEIINYRLIVVKGSITELGVTKRTVNGFINCCINGLQAEWAVHKGKFKCLVLLLPGINNINLSYGSSESNLRIVLKPNDTKLCIIPIYLICKGHDGKFQSPNGCDNSVESACSRIGLGVQLIQCLFAEKLKENGFTKKSFQIENDLNNSASICRVFHSKLPLSAARSWDQNDLWEYFGRELMLSELGSDNRKYLVFLSCTLWDGRKVIGDPALAGGGLALIGTGCLHTWPTTLDEVTPCFTNNTKIGSDLLDNSCYRGTYGGCYSTTLGSVCHEIGHMFNLGHSETGIMSRGFDYTNLVFTTGHHCLDETFNKGHIDLLPVLEVGSGDSPRETVPSKPIAKSTHYEDDLTHLTHACAAILAHHKWFNDDKIPFSSIHYDSIRRVLTSEAGLKVVQIRGACGAVLKSWELGTKALCKHLVVPRMFQNKTATLVAINTNGFIYTKQLC